MWDVWSLMSIKASEAFSIKAPSTVRSVMVTSVTSLDSSCP